MYLHTFEFHWSGTLSQHPGRLANARLSSHSFFPNIIYLVDGALRSLPHAWLANQSRFYISPTGLFMDETSRFILFLHWPSWTYKEAQPAHSR